jgi:hypothetical protein
MHTILLRILLWVPLWRVAEQLFRVSLVVPSSHSQAGD